jgi:5'-nucleotidase/UDP-sugar diphosphatase
MISHAVATTTRSTTLLRTPCARCWARRQIWKTWGVCAHPFCAGPITRYDLAKALPFGNTMVKFRVTGAQLRELLRRTRPAVSGIRYRYQGGELVEVTVNGQPLQEDRQYLVSTNSYFAQRYLQPMGIAYEDTGRKRLDVVSDYILKHKRIRPAYDGRRVVDSTVY